ncbi:hypothetical protein QBC34DRAFT_162336 [Podospora aff. communis PSN243]|uniref:Uncharacterized protein n=1 Tax=Podospora aff. communis PSN243 TaxID=3040156 RepID=A0AAV9GA02_9PEZI|nr:hypothetical protein QBC34DRAFT_162336 [Podospora aff. communis PSN243]
MLGTRSKEHANPLDRFASEPCASCAGRMTATSLEKQAHVRRRTIAVRSRRIQFARPENVIPQRQATSTQQSAPNCPRVLRKTSAGGAPGGSKSRERWRVRGELHGKEHPSMAHPWQIAGRWVLQAAFPDAGGWRWRRAAANLDSPPLSKTVIISQDHIARWDTFQSASSPPLTALSRVVHSRGRETRGKKAVAALRALSRNPEFDMVNEARNSILRLFLESIRYLGQVLSRVWG